MPTEISDKDKHFYLDRALMAADWYVNSQLSTTQLIGCDANIGRFLYYYYMPEKKWVPGINWTHGRALFVLTDAYAITRDAKYLEAAEKGARYIRALQPLDPYYSVTHGAIAERYPHENFAGLLDGAQAASGLLMLYHCTQNPDYLRRGVAFCDFLLRNWRRDVGVPRHCTFYPECVYFPDDPVDAIHQATVIPMWHAYNITGEGRYVEVIVDAANRVLMCQREDGGINAIADIDALEALPLNHHWGLGEGKDRYLLRNDDGIVVVVLAAYKLTGDRKYLDAMVAYANWTMANEPHIRPYNAFGVQANNVLDISRMAGIDNSAWVVKHLEDYCLSKQALGTGDPMAEGGFRGEDEEGDAGIFGGKGLDYVPNRNTCYMAGTLFRLSGKGTGTGFSVYGLGDGIERVVRKRDDNVAPTRHLNE
ncbi:MAG: hypothetical protein O3A51_10705 [Verrucomicrobia bacterium]|nr:hypothetical protein [Verrucomicrobiota bacterium]